MDKKLLEQLINTLIKEKGGSKEDYYNLLNTYAYHESKLDSKKQQSNNGPGKGLFQFEEGLHKGGITALKRTKNYLKSNNIAEPNWIDSISKTTSLDASKLSGVQQKIIMLGNLRKHPKGDLKDLWDGKENLTSFWAKNHWSGNKKDIQERTNSFASSLKEYRSIITPNMETTSKLPHKTNIKDVMSTQFSEIKDLVTNPKRFGNNFIKQLNHNDTYQGKILKKEEENYNIYKQKQDSINKVTNKAAGGFINQYIQDKSLNSFEGGGTHEQNPLGGIPQGMGPNNQINKVEEGETSFNIKGTKFIFSHRINTTK